MASSAAPIPSSTPKIAGTIRSKNPLKGAVEVLPERLYYAALKAPPPSHNILASTPRRNKSDPVVKKQIHFFNIDNELIYWNFFLDFGPLNLGQLMRFSNKLHDKLRKFPVVCFYSSTVPAKRANAIFLICAWQMLYLNRTPEEAWAGFDTSSSAAAITTAESSPKKKENETLTSVSPSNCSLPPVSSSQGAVTIAALPPFHDASPCACTYDLSVLDCLNGMQHARRCGFWDHETFDVEEYEHFEQVENGDLNWIVRDRIIAFAGPSYERRVSPEGYCTLAPADYIPYFQRRNVGLVVRLNKKMYNEQDFVNAGIQHLEAFFLDGSCPSMNILMKVVSAFEAVPQNKAFAVHCKAGLGRTGTCIGAYLMKHFRFTAAEVIAWMRICRPGCVIGPQQHFLAQIESKMWQEGELTRGGVPKLIASAGSEAEEESDHDSLLKKNKHNGEMEMDEAIQGRAGQAEGLLAARNARTTNSQHGRSIKTDVNATSSSSNSSGGVTPTSITAVPVTPEATSKQKAAPALVTPDSAKQPEQLWCN